MTFTFDSVDRKSPAVLTLQQKLSKAEDLLLEAYYILPREGDPIAQKVKEALWAVREQLYTFEGK